MIDQDFRHAYRSSSEKFHGFFRSSLDRCNRPVRTRKTQACLLDLVAPVQSFTNALYPTVYLSGVRAAPTYGAVIVLLSKVTAAVCASALPSKFTPVVIVIEASARIFPLNIEFVPNVAELPTCQKIFLA
jgi:hypothetical protein